MDKIEYKDTKKDGKTLYRYRQSAAVVKPSGFIRLVYDLKPETDMPLIKSVPDGVKSGTAEI